MKKVSLKVKIVAVVSVLTLVILPFAFWAFHGIISAISRFIVASASLKITLLATLAASILGYLAYLALENRDKAQSSLRYDRTSGKTEDELKAELSSVNKKYHSLTVGYSIFIAVAVLAATLLPSYGGYYRGVQIGKSTVITKKAQPEYLWRTPWTIAALSVTSRAGNIVGDFNIQDTTYLPGTSQYSTPVKARGFNPGFQTVVIQDNSNSTASSCVFTSQTPVSGGAFAKSLSRAISFIDKGLQYNSVDIWTYCDKKVAKMVVPVIRMSGQPESHPVPGGVVIYDGNDATLLKTVKAGTLPGPVYPMSLAAAQRTSLASTLGLVNKIFSRAGYETTDALGEGTEYPANVTEFLLAKKAGGWDYVTPLTPRGKSFTITAVSAISADHVTAGVLNTLTVHKLAVSREGNKALSDRVRAAFPQLGWAAGLELIEIIPTSSNTWDATLSNGRAVANRIAVDAQGSLCLQDVNGKTINCVSINGTAQTPTDSTGASVIDDTTLNPTSLTSLTNKQLAQLAVKLAAEQLRRATAG